MSALMDVEGDRSEERANHTFVFLPIGTAIPDFKQVTSVSVVPFDDDGNIVAACLEHRGLDIPGGHVEPKHATCEDTARDETTEEICATLGELRLVGVIESTMLRNSKPTYMVIYTSRVASFEPLKFKKGEKSKGRKILIPEDFLRKHSGFPLMPEIVARAREIDQKERSPYAGQSTPTWAAPVL
jgi:ADP-ribose pyrophosphatase YjhB (NUDIX family)